MRKTRFKHTFIYYVGLLFCLPLAPLVFYEGKKTLKHIPKLPEAKEPTNTINTGYKKNTSVLFLGESTIAGVGVKYHKDGFAGNFCSALAKLLATNITYTVIAKSGYTAKKIRTKLLPKLQSVTADMIIIGLGANDTFCLKSPRKWIKDIDNLITALQQIYPNSPIYFTNMPPIKSFPAFTKSLQFCLGNLAILLGNSLQNYVKQKHGVYYNSEQITLKKWQKKHIIKDSNTAAFFSDGVHPNTIGYRLWGTDMAFFVAKKKHLK